MPHRIPFSALAAGALLATAMIGCNQTQQAQSTQSLRGTSDISFLCVAERDGDYVGRPIDACPSVGSESNNLLGLALQQETGEVAVVDMTACREGTQCRVGVPDLELTQPGINFLPVGAEPVSIVSTPGGLASFVAVAEPGKEGLFALPTSCIGPRPQSAPFRDLRTWPACRLPAAPGPMQVLVDDMRTTSCDGDDGGQAERVECPADLSQEFVNPGRRKLAVTLPDVGMIAVIDAQQVLDGAPGSFEDCPIEQLLPLQVDLPQEAEQSVPDDMAVADAACLPKSVSVLPPTQTFKSSPSDMAASGQRLYVSDYDAPVVHVLDTTDKCALRELPPLLPTSYTEPANVVTTRRVAVSPKTSTGEQFVYAVDGSQSRAAGSIMVFDVSPQATQRTPILRPRSTYIWGEPPDRIRFDQEVRDIEFARQDRPVADPETGVAVEGVICDPDPSKSPSSSPGALYRPSSDGTGASPVKLRGVFGFAVLQSGIIAVIDVEDLDAPCRRPKRVNRSEEPDFRGCAGDPFRDALEVGETPTVSDEFSCNIFERHRTRAGTFFNDGSFGTAPFLRAFPQLRGPDGTSLAVDRTERGKGNPRLLGVNFTPQQGQDGDARVFVGATEYSNDAKSLDRLRLDPSLAQRNSLVLPFVEPRAYSGTSINTVTFEGPVRGAATAQFEVVSAEELSSAASSDGPLGVFSGGLNAGFCTAGIEDLPAMRLRGQTLLSEAADSTLDAFAVQHADYVEVTAELLDSDDRYWDSKPGSQCGAAYQSQAQRLGGHNACQLFFGTAELPDRHRELRIVRAYDDRLVVEPRVLGTTGERDATLDMVQCCFPGGVEFQVRASDQWVMHTNGRMPHPIEINPQTLACQRSCDPLISGRNGRIFEISCDGDACSQNAESEPSIGPSDFASTDGVEGEPSRRALACVLQSHPEGGVQPGAEGAECIFEGLTARFAVYRGTNPSVRGMQFGWTAVGGFRAMAIDLYGVNRSHPTAMPEKLVYVPQVNRLVIADGDATGLFFVGLRRNDGGPGFSEPTFAY